MKRLVLLSLVLTMGAAQAFADHPTGATTADIRQLQSEADRLDESLAQLNDGSPRAAEFRRREAEIRDELIWLRGQVRRHQRDESQGLGASQADVEELRRSIVALRNDVDRTLDTRPRATGDLSVPNGTEMAVRLETALSSKTARPEDRVEGTVAESVRVDGRVAIPAGTRVRGIVQDARAGQPSVQRWAPGAHVRPAVDAQRPSRGHPLERRQPRRRGARTRRGPAWAPCSAASWAGSWTARRAR